MDSDGLNLIEEIFVNSHNTLLNMKENNLDKDSELSKIYDLLYDTCDTILELLDIIKEGKY